MHQDYTKICRVCMTDGSRDIFHKPSMSMASSADGTATGTTTATNANAPSKGTSPLERLLEKLRYVTMMKIEENDDLPRLLCDLCIVQLNVAYNFKRQAVENDTKLRQYFIENGISSNQPPAATLNDVSSLRNSFTVVNHNSQASPATSRFPILPIVIKTEPSDVDAFSDVTTETNAEMERIDRDRFQTQTVNTINSSPEENGRLLNASRFSNRSQSSMVYVNSGYEFNSVTPSSDIEFIQNYQLTKSGENSTANNSRSRENTAERQTTTSAATIRERSINRSPGSRHSNSSPATSHMRAVSRREIANLSIDMVTSTVVTNEPKEQRRVLGKTKRVNNSPLTSTPKSKSSSSLSSLSSVAAKLVAARKNAGNVARTTTPVSLGRRDAAVKRAHIERRIKEASGSGKAKHSKSSNVGEVRAQKMIVVNPFNAAKQLNSSSGSSSGKSKSHRRSENNIRKKKQEKLLRPKIEPPASKKI